MNKHERRVKLNKGKQRELLFNVASRIGSLRKLSISLKIPYSTIKEYAQEKFLIPESLFNYLIEYLLIDKESLEVTYLSANWGASIGGKKGIKSLERKYPDKIKEWRRQAIKHSSYSNSKEILLPEVNEKLAEFIGTYLGDGTMTKYFVRISGDYRYDLNYFIYINKLVEELFGISSSIKKNKIHNTSYLTVYSNKLCSFLNKEFGLKYGNKIRNKSCIPQIIFDNQKLAIACLRGLVDTDGSVSRRGRGGSQFCVQFYSHNPILLDQVYKIGKDIGIFTYFTGKEVGTNKWENVVKYFKIVGSSNHKHIIRFYNRAYNNKTIYLKEVPNYMSQDLYKDLKLPFKTAL
ncbi:hypothetical protein HYW74_02100 [Candidatus Pacearchaeota archaeon]|nr:hypothetical protein [Candidatus Pacearchaeota archaeon]